MEAWELWQQFAASGKIEDYLRYKAAVEEKAGGEEDAADHQRDRHPGAPVG